MKSTPWLGGKALESLSYPLLHPATLVFQPPVLRLESGGATFSALVTLPVDLDLQVDPDEVRLVWGDHLLARGLEVFVQDSWSRIIEVVFERQPLDVLGLGSKSLSVFGCDSAGTGFVAETQLQILPLRQGIWQESPVGTLPIVLRVGGGTTENSATHIYDCTGRLVLGKAGLIDHEGKLVWDGKGSAGATIPSGIYFVQIRTGRRVLSGRLIPLR